MDAYWNHNTAYHPLLVADARKRGGRVLDIGCGEGLLLERLAPYAGEVVGIDPDSRIIGRAQQRLAAVPNHSLMEGDFIATSLTAFGGRFETITCVAALHHMDLRQALLRMRELLSPGGKLLVIGLSANKTLTDMVLSGLAMLPIRVMDRVHGAAHDIGVRIADPKEALHEIRRTAREVLPGVVVRRRFYYRYLLSWTKPQADEREA